MPELAGEPSRVTAAGEPPTLIDEYVGLVNGAEPRVSIAHMRSPSGWAELELAALAEELAELGDRLVLVAAEA